MMGPRILGILTSTLLLLPTIVHAAKTDEEMAEQAALIKKRNEKYSVVDDSLFKYNQTMREKDYWTCGHGYWSTYRFCGFDPDAATPPVEDMCVHRPRWACDPLRCLWVTEAETDSPSIPGGYCRIKCKLTGKDLNILKHDMERRNNYCPKTRCVWAMPRKEASLDEGVCVLDTSIFNTDGQKKSEDEPIVNEEFLLEQSKDGTILDGSITEDKALEYEILWQKCSILAFFGPCRHYLQAASRKVFSRTCVLQTEDVKARAAAKGWDDAKIQTILDGFAGKHAIRGLECDPFIGVDHLAGASGLNLSWVAAFLLLF